MSSLVAHMRATLSGHLLNKPGFAALVIRTLLYCVNQNEISLQKTTSTRIRRNYVLGPCRKLFCMEVEA
jgi:hypothetical protein